MTTVNLQFSIDVPNERIYLGVIHAPISSSLPSNVQYVSFANGSGQVIYNDRPPLPVSFTDPSPYQSYLNAWITTQALATPALTLSQAQAVKSTLTDAVWAVKRQAAVSVATSLGTFNFDASDDDLSNALNSSSWMPAMANLISQIGSVNGGASSVISSLVNSINTVVVNGVNSTVVGGINTDLSALVTSINSDLTNLLADINSELNTAATNVSSIATVTNANLSGITTELNLTIDQVNAGLGSTISHSTYSNMGGAGFSGGVGSGVGAVAAGSTIGTIGTVSATYSGPGAPPSLTAPVMILPVGSTTYPAFTLADQFAVVTAIQTQRANEAAARAVKQAAISALSTITAVAAYDATTGW